MGSKPGRSVLQTIFKHLINSLKPRRFKGDLVGSDYLGNKYYETPMPANSSRKNAARYFEPEVKDNFEQEMPAEWEAWLRYRRKEPPSEAEVMQNLAIMKMKKKNAATLEDEVQASRLPKDDKLTVGKPVGFPMYSEYQSPKPEDSNNNKN